MGFKLSKDGRKLKYGIDVCVRCGHERKPREQFGRIYPGCPSVEPKWCMDCVKHVGQWIRGCAICGTSLDYTFAGIGGFGGHGRKGPIAVELVDFYHNRNPICETCKTKYKQQIAEGYNMTTTKLTAVATSPVKPTTAPVDPVVELAAIQAERDGLNQREQNLISKFTAKLETQLAEASETMNMLVNRLKAPIEFLNEERFKASREILHISVEKPKPVKPLKADKKDKNTSKGKPGKKKPGKKINSAIKRVGKAMTAEEISKETGLTVKFVTEYLTSGDNAMRYEKVGEAFNIRKV